MRIGLILDAKMLVGKFKGFTAEDCFGKRELNKVVISNSYCDLFGCKKQLRFIYVEPIDLEKNKFTLIEDFGFGSMKVLSGFCSNDTTTIENAVFSKEPKLDVN